MVRPLPPAVLLLSLCAACASAGDSQAEADRDQPKKTEPVNATPPANPPNDAPPAASDPTAPQAADASGDLESFEATVEIDDQPGGKRLQAVWLVSGKTRRVIDYRANEWWKPFDGRKVKATGASYSPEGQAISADHFRVHSLELLDPTPDDDLWMVSKQESFTGAFVTQTWPKQSKLGGETATIFRSDEGEDFWLHDATAITIELDKSVTIKARRVEPSNFVARPGGPYLWVLESES